MEIVTISNKSAKKEKEEIIEKIEAVLAAEGEEIEKAAEEIAPGFDYEKAAEELEAEEADAAEAESAEAECHDEAEAESVEPEIPEKSENEVTVESVEQPLPPAMVSPSKYPKESNVPTNWFGRTFLRDKHQIVFGITLLMLVGVLGWWTYDYIIPLCRSEKTTALVGGKSVEIRLIPGTVEENLEFNEIEYDSNDIVSPAFDEEAKASTQIVLDYVDYSTVEKTEQVESESVVELDPELESGVQKTTKGNDGEGVFTYKTKLINGVESGTERELKEWITEPHNTVLHLGTKRTGHEGTYTIDKTFTANCSAYWMGNNCYGAGGGKCVYGTVAVDRSIYPYGTEFWIEGYGFAVANDCGTSIKGNKLDLWMDSFAESCRWGRRHMTTYVLKEAK